MRSNDNHMFRLRWVREPAAIVREHWITVLALLATLGLAAPVIYDTIRIALRNLMDRAYFAALGDAFLVLVAGLIAYGSTVYLLARIGHLKRLSRGASDTPDSFVADEQSDDGASVLALVPSYCEEPPVIMRSLISAALQPHTSRVVLLIDDLPQHPVPASLQAARDLPGRIMEMMRPIREDCERALDRFQRTLQGERADLPTEARELARLCRQVAAWFDAQSRLYCITDVTNDEFFVNLTFRLPASQWAQTADRWDRLADSAGASLSPAQLRAEYLRLVSHFQVEISSFERKQFVNLPHAANKAMNINSYIGLLGGSYRRQQTSTSQQLSRCAADDADLVIADADFVLILDADTIVSLDYTPKLLARFREPGGERVAVVQSPYSTIPGGRNVLQRIAGAQTDIQYLVIRA